MPDERVPTELGALRVRRLGSGPPAVLWHSLFVDSRSWQRVDSELAADRTLIEIDGPAHGGSAPATRRFTLDDCAAAAGRILDALGVDGPVDWVGSAWGGHVGMVLAATAPERVRSLATFGSPVPALTAAERRRIVPLVAAYRLVGPAKPLRSAVADALLFPAVRTGQPEITELITDSLRRADRRGMYLAMRSVMLGRPDLTGLLPRITAPTLLATGDDDPMWTTAATAAAATTLPRGTARIIAGSRHLAALEAPAATVVAVRQLWQSV